MNFVRRRTLYEILGVDKFASINEIKAAYKKRARETHPDLKGDEDEFKEVGRAYRILINPQLRADYDKSGKEKGGKDEDMYEKAWEMILFAFNASITNLPDNMVDNFNFVEAMGKIIFAIGDKRKNIIRNSQKEIKRLKKIFKHIKYKGCWRDIIAQELDTRIQKLEEDIAVEIITLKVVDLAKIILKDYVFVPGMNFGYKVEFSFSDVYSDSTGTWS